MPKASKKTKDHVLRVRLDKDGRLTLSRQSVFVGRGDTITWVLSGGRAASFAVIIPANVPLLNWSCKVKKGKVISGRVRGSAAWGVYPYAVCLCQDDRLLVIDPEIIFPPPKGGRN